MDTPPPPTPDRWGGKLWPLVTLGLVGGAWLTFLFVLDYTERLMEAYGPCEDVCDSLGRAAFVNRRTQPYYTLIVFLDALAVVSLAFHSRPGWPRVLKVVAVVLLVPSAGFHGLLWVVGSIFAD
ncbi:MAG: hypothetical protein U0792_24800 [Gemmataceae bacterium]